MNETSTDHSTGSRANRYTIRVRGHLDQRWAEWFDSLSLKHEDDGTTVLDGPLTDQSALHGVFHKLRDLGLPIISVQLMDSKE